MVAGSGKIGVNSRAVSLVSRDSNTRRTERADRGSGGLESGVGIEVWAISHDFAAVLRSARPVVVAVTVLWITRSAKIT